MKHCISILSLFVCGVMMSPAGATSFDNNRPLVASGPGTSTYVKTPTVTLQKTTPGGGAEIYDPSKPSGWTSGGTSFPQNSAQGQGAEQFIRSLRSEEDNCASDMRKQNPNMSRKDALESCCGGKWWYTYIQNKFNNNYNQNISLAVGMPDKLAERVTQVTTRNGYTDLRMQTDIDDSVLDAIHQYCTDYVAEKLAREASSANKEEFGKCTDADAERLKGKGATMWGFNKGLGKCVIRGCKDGMCIALETRSGTANFGNSNGFCKNGNKVSADDHRCQKDLDAINEINKGKINLIDSDGWTPLTAAISGGCSIDDKSVCTADNARALQLIQDGADINKSECVNGLTPLMWATVRQDQPLIDILISRGANLNTRVGRSDECVKKGWPQNTMEYQNDTACYLANKLEIVDSINLPSCINYAREAEENEKKMAAIGEQVHKTPQMPKTPNFEDVQLPSLPSDLADISGKLPQSATREELRDIKKTIRQENREERRDARQERREERQAARNGNSDPGVSSEDMATFQENFDALQENFKPM